MMTFTDFLGLAGLATPFLIVLIKQTGIQKTQTEILKNIERHSIENKEFHLNKENLCQLAHDGFKRGLVEDIAKAS